MIVDPDMPDHWKTRMLADLLNDELAPVYLLRLWGHCQNRKKSIFDRLPPAAVKAICRYQGDPNDLESALTECGFVHRDDDGTLEVVGWAEHNANLWSAWENGKKGGRPKKPAENPPDNPEKPTGNPQETGRSPDEGDEGDEGERPKAGLTPDRFPEFWQAYPKKRKKAEARKKWKAKKLDRIADQIISDVQNRQRRDKRWVEGFVPDPTTYINGERWEDEIESGQGGPSEPRSPSQRRLN